MNDWPVARCTGKHYRRKRSGEEATIILGKVAPDKKLHVKVKTNLGHMIVIIEKGQVTCPECNTVLDWDSNQERKENLDGNVDRL